MKKRLLSLAATAVAVILAACGQKVNYMWDYQDFDILILVEDADGQNLLSDRDSNGGILYGSIHDYEMKIVYDGETYDLQRLPGTRAAEPVMPVMKGFRLEGYRNSAKLWFGQFSNDTKEYRGESFTILWGDGTSSLVEFDLYPMPAAGDENPSYYQATRLDGTVNSTVSLSVTVTAGRDGVGSGTVSVKRR